MKRPGHMTEIMAKNDDTQCLIDMKRVESAWLHEGGVTVRMRNGANIWVTQESWDRAVEETL